MPGPFVTVLVVDVAGTRSAYDRLRSAVSTHGGREVRATDEGLIAAFPSAVAAARCAIEMQTDAGAGGMRIGLDAGEPEIDGDDLYGEPITVALRLCDHAGDREILASETVCRIAGPHLSRPVRAVGALKLRGVPARVVAAQVAWGEEEVEPEAQIARDSIEVVIADDQALVRAGFRVILEEEPDIAVVGEAPDGRAAVDVVLRRRPDVVLMDIRMPELDGLQAAERLLSEPDLGVAVIMLTTFDQREYVYEALRIGASGFLLKDAPADRLLDAVRVVAAGDALLAPSITRSLIGQFTRVARPDPDGVPEALAELTYRELDVLRLIAAGLSNAEIAGELVLGESTIKTHVASVLRKLGLRDRVQAVVVAYESGLVAPESPL